MAFLLLAHLSSLATLQLSCLAAASLKSCTSKANKESNSQNSTLNPAYQCPKAMPTFYPYPINGNLLP